MKKFPSPLSQQNMLCVPSRSARCGPGPLSAWFGRTLEPNQAGGRPRGRVGGCQDLISGKERVTEEKRKQQTDLHAKVIMQFLERARMPREAASPSSAREPS